MRRTGTLIRSDHINNHVFTASAEDADGMTLLLHHEPQVLLDDLTSVIDVALIVAFVTGVHLLRRGTITVATLAHALSVAFLVFSIGHYVEKHMIGLEGLENLVVRRRPGRGGFADWSSAGILSVAAIAVLVARFWKCKGVNFDCVVGDEAPIHYACKILRLQFFLPVFMTTVVFVYLCISMRLNAVFGGSVLHPQGGGYALTVLASPALVSTLCVSGCLSVLLYSVLVEAQGTCLPLHQENRGKYSPETNPYLRAQYGSPAGGVTNIYNRDNSGKLHPDSLASAKHGAWAAYHGGRQDPTTVQQPSSHDNYRSLRQNYHLDSDSLCQLYGNAGQHHPDSNESTRYEEEADDGRWRPRGYGEKQRSVTNFPRPMMSGEGRGGEGGGGGTGGAEYLEGTAHALDAPFLPFPGGMHSGGRLKKGRPTVFSQSAPGERQRNEITGRLLYESNQEEARRMTPPIEQSEDALRDRVTQPPPPRGDGGLMSSVSSSVGGGGYHAEGPASFRAFDIEPDGSNEASVAAASVSAGRGTFNKQPALRCRRLTSSGGVRTGEAGPLPPSPTVMRDRDALFNNSRSRAGPRRRSMVRGRGDGGNRKTTWIDNGWTSSSSSSSSSDGGRSSRSSGGEDHDIHSIDRSVLSRSKNATTAIPATTRANASSWKFSSPSSRGEEPTNKQASYFSASLGGGSSLDGRRRRRVDSFRGQGKGWRRTHYNNHDHLSPRSAISYNSPPTLQPSIASVTRSSSSGGSSAGASDKEGAAAAAEYINLAGNQWVQGERPAGENNEAVVGGGGNDRCFVFAGDRSLRLNGEGVGLVRRRQGWAT